MLSEDGGVFDGEFELLRLDVVDAFGSQTGTESVVDPDVETRGDEGVDNG